MPTTFPTSLDAFPNPGAATLEDAAGFYHDEQHANANDAIEALQAKLGISEPAAQDAPLANMVLASSTNGRSKWRPIAATDIAAGATFAKLQEFTYSTLAGAFSWQNIPQTYRSLRVEWQALGDQAGAVNMVMRLSADGTTFDASANYDFQYVIGFGATAGSTEGLAQTELRVGSIKNDQTGYGIIEIPNYTGSSFYHWLAARWGQRNSLATGNMFAAVASEQWRNVGPVRGIQFFPASGQVQAGSRFTLWGIP